MMNGSFCLLLLLQCCSSWLTVDSKLLSSPTINVTGAISASRSDVWPLVRAVDQWSSFTDTFVPELIGGNEIVEVGQEILFTTEFKLFSQQTIDRIYDIVEEERICWSLESLVLGADEKELELSPKVLRTTGRCIELFDDGNDNTIIHNWISYGGILAPAVLLSTGSELKKLFQEFNQDLAVQF